MLSRVGEKGFAISSTDSSYFITSGMKFLIASACQRVAKSLLKIKRNNRKTNKSIFKKSPNRMKRNILKTLIFKKNKKLCFPFKIRKKLVCTSVSDFPMLI